MNRIQDSQGAGPSSARLKATSVAAPEGEADEGVPLPSGDEGDRDQDGKLGLEREKGQHEAGGELPAPKQGEPREHDAGDGETDLPRPDAPSRAGRQEQEDDREIPSGAGRPATPDADQQQEQRSRDHRGVGEAERQRADRHGDRQHRRRIDPGVEDDRPLEPPPVRVRQEVGETPAVGERGVVPCRRQPPGGVEDHEILPWSIAVEQKGYAGPEAAERQHRQVDARRQGQTRR